MANVVLLNICYDVCVKLHSSHLLALCLLVAAPDFRRLVVFFVLGRAPQPDQSRPLFGNRWLRLGAQVLAAVLVLGCVALSLHKNVQRSEAHGHLAPKPPLHGIWNVHEIVADGVVQPPLRSDPRYWQRVFFHPGFPGYQPPMLQVTRLDQGRQVYRLNLNTEQRTVGLSKFGGPAWNATLRYSEPAPDILVLQGTLDGRQVRITLRRVDESRLPINQGTHWISDRP
jgi:hypothetical protein